MVKKFNPVQSQQRENLKIGNLNMGKALMKKMKSPQLLLAFSAGGI